MTLPRTRLVATRTAAVFTALAAVAAIAIAAPGAEAKGRWVVKGAGFGHGIGMSQYGALGSAKAGMTYDKILAQYYSGTTVGPTSSQTVRVLLRPNLSSVGVSGASAACGATLNEGTTYTAKRRGRRVVLNSKGGGRVASCGKVLSASGGDSVALGGRAYRGAIEVRVAKVPGKLNAINAVELEDYVRGVISKESPSSWPLEALKAQAVAARSYAISTPVRGAGFNQYADTRSQVYGGVAAETARTNQAVAETALQVVMFRGAVAQTFFFSTSGGHTENNENSFLGGTPEPYLRGVPDPNEAQAGSPYHAWTRKFSQGGLQAELGGLVKGKLKRIDIVKRGVSPRIVKAKIVGTGGSSNASGPTLRARLGLPDTWATFVSPGQAGKARARAAVAELYAGW
jgi:stage II sporulation protein D